MRTAVLIRSAAISCCAILSAPALAEPCSQRFPGSCRNEVSTTIVRGVGNTVTITRPGRARQVKTVRTARVKSHARRGKAAVAARKPSLRATFAPRPLPAPDRAAKPPTPAPDMAARAVARPSPAPVSELGPMPVDNAPTPRLMVDDAFNLLTATDQVNSALEHALLSRRDQMAGSASRWPEDDR